MALLILYHGLPFRAILKEISFKYELTKDYGSTIEVSNTQWTSIGINASNIKNIIFIQGYHNDDSRFCGSLLATVQNDEVKVICGRSTGGFDLRYFTIQYTKSSS